MSSISRSCSLEYQRLPSSAWQGVSFPSVDHLDARGRATSVPPSACYELYFFLFSVGRDEGRNRPAARSGQQGFDLNNNGGCEKHHFRIRTTATSLSRDCSFSNTNDIIGRLRYSRTIPRISKEYLRKIPFIDSCCNHVIHTFIHLVALYLIVITKKG